MRYKNRLSSLVLLLSAFVLGLSGCTREDDPDREAVYFGLQGGWVVRTHMRGATDLSAGLNSYAFGFESVEGILFIGQNNGRDYILADYRTHEANGLTLLEIECPSDPSVCDSIGGVWQSLNISRRAANFARRTVTGELERLEFRQ